MVHHCMKLQKAGVVHPVEAEALPEEPGVTSQKPSGTRHHHHGNTFVIEVSSGL
jgi:hypothetical protein